MSAISLFLLPFEYQLLYRIPDRVKIFSPEKKSAGPDTSNHVRFRVMRARKQFDC